MKYLILCLLFVGCSKKLDLDGFICPVKLTKDTDFRTERNIKLELLEDCDDYKKGENLDIIVSRVYKDYVTMNVKDHRARVLSARSLHYRVPILGKEGDKYYSKIETSYSLDAMRGFIDNQSDVESELSSMPSGNYRFLPKGTPLIIDSY